MVKKSLLTAVLVLVMTGMSFAALTDDFESYADQTALETAWPLSWLAGGGESAIQLAVGEKNHTLGGNQAIKVDGSNQRSSRELTTDIVGSGYVEAWFYDDGYTAGENTHWQLLTRSPDGWAAYPTIGVNPDGYPHPANRYFYQLSDWQVTYVGPVRTKGWHQVIFDVDTGNLVLDGTVLGTDLALKNNGIGYIHVGNPWWQGNDTATYFDDIVAVPEPITVLLLGVGGLTMIRRKRACISKLDDIS